ncbi:hypothetical protein SGPA1_31575 [Streptomyces misionensis JCM 4497]
MVGVRPGRGRGPYGVLQARRRHPDRRAVRGAAAHPARRPVRARPGVRALRGGPLLRRRPVGVRQRAAGPGHRLDPRGRPAAADDDPAQRRPDRAAGRARAGQPHPGRRQRPLAGRDGGGHRTRAAADLPVVHPRGRPGDAAAHRSDPGRRLPRGERRGDRAGEQFPVQRVAGGRAAPGHRGGPYGEDAAARVGRLVHQGRDAPAAGPRIQHEFCQPGRITS